MKKQYTSPETKVHPINMSQSMLAGSLQLHDNKGTSDFNVLLAPRRGNDYDDDMDTDFGGSSVWSR